MKISENQLSIIGCVLIMVCFCMFSLYNISSNGQQANDNTHRLDSIGEDTIVSTQVLTFEYNGDKYIEFIRDDRSYVIHDPKCNCLTNKLNNITSVITKNANNNTANTESKISDLDVNNRKNFRILIDKIAELEKKVNSIPRGYVAKPVVKKTTPIKKQTVKKDIKKK